MVLLDRCFQNSYQVSNLITTSFPQKFAWEYEEETEENSDGVSDVVSGSRDWYAYTRGDVKELIIRKTSDQKFEKKITVPYGLRHFQFHENQLITLGTNSEFQKLTEVRGNVFIIS